MKNILFIYLFMMIFCSESFSQDMAVKHTVAMPVSLQKHVYLMTPEEVEESKKYGTILLKPSERVAIEAEWAANRAKASLPREPSDREIEMEAMRFKLTPAERSAARTRLMAE